MSNLTGWKASPGKYRVVAHDPWEGFGQAIDATGKKLLPEDVGAGDTDSLASAEARARRYGHLGNMVVYDDQGNQVFELDW